MKATTIEHAPPKVFFTEKLRLKGLEFAACERCNVGSSALDQAAALFCLTMRDAFADPEPDAYLQKLVRGVKNNAPDFIEFISGNAEGVHLKFNGLFRPLVKIKVDERLFKDWIFPWTAKQACALWYEETGNIFSENQFIWVNWITNAQIVTGGVPDKLLRMLQNSGMLEQGKLNSSDQFFYRFSVSRKPSESGVGLFMIGAQKSSVGLAVVGNKKDIRKLPTAFSKGGLYSTNPVDGICSWIPTEKA